MKIDKPETLKQALASMRLENSSLSSEVEALIQRALNERNVDTEDVKSLLLKPYIKDR